MITNGPASKFLKENVKVQNQTSLQPDYTFKMLYDEAKRDLFLKNPLIKLTHTLSRSTSQPISLYVPKFNPDKFNLDKKIKEIRRITKETPINSSKKGNISYSKANRDIVYESTKLLNSINKKRANSLNDEDPLISVFLSDNKEILINNHLLKELKEEEKQIRRKEEHMTMTLNKKREMFQSEQTSFQKAINSQKKLYDEIEEILFNLQRNNKQLGDTEREYKVDYKLMEEDVDKYLELIDNKRIYAKFIHRILAKDNSRFQRKLLPGLENYGIHLNNRKLNYSELARQTV